MWFKGLFRMRFSKTIPRTNILAYIASKHPVVHFTYKLIMNLVLKFNGQVGDALTSIYNLRRNNSLRGARIDASRTSSAIVFCGSKVVIQLNINYQFT